jgi:hypothetical protein
MSTRWTFICSVNTFSDYFSEKNLGQEKSLLRRLLSPGPRLRRRVLKEGSAENAASQTGLKFFLRKNSLIFIVR